MDKITINLFFQNLQNNKLILWNILAVTFWSKTFHKALLESFKSNKNIIWVTTDEDYTFFFLKDINKRTVHCSAAIGLHLYKNVSGLCNMSFIIQYPLATFHCSKDHFYQHLNLLETNCPLKTAIHVYFRFSLLFSRQKNSNSFPGISRPVISHDNHMTVIGQLFQV